MQTYDWARELPFAVLLTDADGKLLYLNARAVVNFADEGGAELIGKNIFNCHPPAAQEKIRQLMTAHTTHVYTIEKNGINKLVYQCPWYRQGVFAGLVELSIELSEKMPHFSR